MTAPAARATASGVLIGAELAAAKPYWLGQNVAIIGGGTIAAIYARALSAVGLQATVTDGTAVTLAGLCAAKSLLKD
jgi:2-dehydro-3-deoxygalactonokinase